MENRIKVRSHPFRLNVVPAKAGTHGPNAGGNPLSRELDPRLRGGDRIEFVSAQRFLALGMLAVAFCFASPSALASQAADAKMQFIEGRVVQESMLGPVLKTATKEYPLTSEMNYLIRTLQDPRLAKSELRLEGTLDANGHFSVERILSVHEGKVYCVRYFCETCNIEGLGPGRCVCCQQPTELQEVPLDPNDHHIIIDR
jgi:hypothetical protein